MVTLSKYGSSLNRVLYKIDGLSTEIKPIEKFLERDDSGKVIATVYLENGSIYTEIDTGKVFMYDKENQIWYEVNFSGSSGGGGDTSDYRSLTNLPSINGISLIGDRSTSQLGLVSTEELDEKLDEATSTDIIQMIQQIFAD